MDCSFIIFFKTTISNYDFKNIFKSPPILIFNGHIVTLKLFLKYSLS